MAHTIANKSKLVARINRIKGQVMALEKALQEEQDCSLILHQIAGCRGAMNGVMAEVVEGHIRSHLVNSKEKKEMQAQAADSLIDLINSYLK